MEKIVQPAGNAKIAIAELQALKRKVVTGAAAATAIEVAEMKAVTHLLSVIGYDGDAGALADQVVDFTPDTVVQAITKAVEAIDNTDDQALTVTITGHGLDTGAYILFDDTIVGMVELHDKAFVIAVTDADTFTLNKTDGGNYTAYVSGGIITTQDGEIECSLATAAYRLVVDFMNTPAV